MSTAVIGVPGFKARSGRTVHLLEDGTVTFDKANGYLSPATAMDAEEFFQAKGDERFGRWRWPENPDYVVYRTDDHDGFMILDERRGKTWTYYWAAIKDDPQYDGPWDAARAYFEAHPERHPWDDAEDGDIWVLTGAGGLTQPWRRVNGSWRSIGTDREHTYDAVAASAGHRIWPEDAS